MSRLLVAAAAAAFLLIPAAQAAPPNQDVTVAFIGLPTAVNATQAMTTVQFQVSVTVDNLVCLPGPGTLTVALAAASAGNGTGNATVSVSPTTLTFNLPPAAAGAVPASAAYTGQQQANLVVSGKSAAAVGTTVTATAASINGCTGITSASGSATQAVAVKVSPLGTATAAGDEGAPVPGLEMPLLALGLVGGAIVLRRRA